MGLEQVLAQMWEERVDFVPGDGPQLRVAVGVDKNFGRVHDEKHVFQQLSDRLTLENKIRLEKQ
jgi:hypothetical protein